MSYKLTGKLFSGIGVAILLGLSLALAGCGKKSVPKTPTSTKAFQTASPEIKAAWQNALSAAASHDYATAILTCRMLQMQSNLNSQQLASVVDTITAVNNELLAAVQKGDQNAIHAMEEVRKGWRMR
jgi:hypothetical protein